jgi:hypothetical protein
MLDPKNDSLVEFNGTYYHKETDKNVIEVLDRFMNCASFKCTRLKLYFGNVITGKDWGEENDCIGYIGRSSGDIKIPILLKNSKSTGGGSILDHCIVKIEYANKRCGGILYQNILYHI